MLLLTRRPNAGDDSVITIGDDITIALVSVEGGSVRLGVQASRETAVHRGEICDEIRAEVEARDIRATAAQAAREAAARLLGD